MLAQKFCDALARCNDVASNPYLSLLVNAVNAVHAKACDHVQPLDTYASELIALIDKSPYFALDPRSLSDSKMKSSINSDGIFYKTAAMARFVSVDS